MRARLSLSAALLAAAVVAPACDCGGERLGEFTPELRLAPTELNFGEVRLGAEGVVSLRLFNDGTGPIELTGAPAVDDAEVAVDPGEVFPVPARDFRALELSWRPTVEGPMQGELVLPLRDPIGEVRVPFRGTAAPNPIAFDPEVIDFGELAVGESATATATLINEGDAAISVQLAVDGRGYLVDGVEALSLSLSPGEARPLTLTFLPPRGGPLDARLVAQVCGPGCGPALVLAGTGLAPRIDVSPRPVDLGEVALGETAAAELTVRNTGVGPLTVSAVFVAGDDPRVEVELPEVPFSVDAGAAVTGTVRYTGEVPEAQLSASLRLSSDDPLSPEVSVPVTARTPGAAMRVIPAALNFGSMAEGELRELDMVVRASGTEAIVVESIELLDDDTGAFSLPAPSPVLPNTLPGGASLLVSLRAEATPAAVSAGVARARALVTGRDEQGTALTAEVALELGTGFGACQPFVVQPNVNLGFVQIGQGTRGSVFVENRGSASCVASRVSPADGFPFDAGFTFRAEDALSLLPGEIGEVVFAFQAASGGARSAVLAIEYEAADAPLRVSATAYGVLGSLAPVPALLELGPIPAGCEVPSRVMSFTNTGGAAVTVDAIVLAPDNGPFSLVSGGGNAIVNPGRSTFVTLTGDASAEGDFLREVVAHTQELGEVPGVVRLEVVDALTPLREDFVVPSGSRADVLFIVDNSGSMFDDQQRLADNFERFIDRASSEGDVDFHIGLTSTDVFNNGARGELIGTPRVLTRATAGLQTRFAERAQLGVEGTPIELGLEAMRLATSEPLRSGLNSGFLRPDAILSVVIVSDEDDSGPISGDPAHDLPPDAYAGHLEALKGAALDHAPVIFSLVGPTFAPRYRELVDRFGGVALDISSPDWGEQLGDLGEVTFSALRTFQLSTPPRDDGTLSVTVDGAPVTEFTVTGRSVQLADAPPAGASVSISYTPDC